MKYNEIGTNVHRTKRFEKDLDRVPYFIKNKAITWINQVEYVGLLEVRKQKGFHDEPLKGSRSGERSIRLNRAYRLIYREMRQHLEILLIEVNKHDY